MSGPACDDCVCDGRGCAFVLPNEQPYFAAFRIATRTKAGDPWSTLGYMAWNKAAWREFFSPAPRPENASIHAPAFLAWLRQRYRYSAEAA